MGKKPDDQALAGADALDSVLSLVGDLDHVVTGEVGQLDGLQIGPQALDGVEVGCIRREPLGGQPCLPLCTSKHSRAPVPSARFAWKRASMAAALGYRARTGAATCEP